MLPLSRMEKENGLLKKVARTRLILLFTKTHASSSILLPAQVSRLGLYQGEKGFGSGLNDYAMYVSCDCDMHLASFCTSVPHFALLFWQTGDVTAKGEQVKPSGERGSRGGRGRHVVWTMFALSGKPHKHLRKRLSLWDSRPWWSGRTGAFSSKDVCLGSRQHVHPRPQSSYEHTFA